MTALGSVRYEWRVDVSCMLQTLNHSDLFFIEGINDVAFSISAKMNNSYLDVCIQKNNFKSAKADVQIAILEKDKKKALSDWKDKCFFMNYFHQSELGIVECGDGNQHNYHFTSDTTIVCSITWYGFVDRIPRENIFLKIQEFYKSTQFSDMIVSVDGVDIPAHKIVVCSYSPVFKAMIRADMEEKKESRINIDNFEVGIVNEMLKFFYTGATEAATDFDTALKMIKLTNMYQIHSLQNICEITLLLHMDIDNVSLILTVADDVNAEKLVDESIKFMVNNHKEIVKRPEFEDLLSKKTEIMQKFICASSET